MQINLNKKHVYLTATLPNFERNTASDQIVFIHFDFYIHSIGASLRIWKWTIFAFYISFPMIFKWRDESLRKK